MVSSDRKRRHDYAEQNRLQHRLIFRQELGISRALAGQLCVTIRSAFNLDYPEWQGFLGNKALVEALLSRLRHQCHTIRIDGPSLRDPQG